MAVSTSGYCKITGLSKAMPKSHYIPLMPALSQQEQSQLFGCKITMASHMDHHYIPIIEFGKGKGPGVISCKITGRVAHTVVKEVPMPEQPAGEMKRVHHYRQDYRYMEPFISRLVNPGERSAMEELMERMAQKTELDSCHYFIYALNDRRTGKTGLVLPYEYEEAIRSGVIEQILLSGDSNSLVVRIKDGPTCTIPMDKVTKNQIERLSQEQLLFDGHGPDREIIEAQRREKAAREKEDREQMAQYLAEMEKKRKDREIMKKEKMKQKMIEKMAEAEEAEKRQKERDAEIKKQYEEAAKIRADAEAAKQAAREQRLAERERKALEEKARRAEELARIAEEAAQKDDAERNEAQKSLLAEEAAAAAAIDSINPYDLSVNELLDHVRDHVGENAEILQQLKEAGESGMSSTEIANLLKASTQEAIEEVYEGGNEEDGDEMDEKLPLDPEELERRKKEREAKRMARKAKHDEQRLKDEEKRNAKLERERKKKEMQERLAALRRGDAEDEAANLRMPEMRQMPTIDIRRRKRPADLELNDGEGDEYVVRTADGREVRSGDDIDDESTVEGRLSPNSSKMEPGRLMRTKNGREFIAGRIIITDDGDEEFVPGKALDLPDGPKFVPGQTIDTKDGPQFVAGKTFVERENYKFVPGHVVDLGGEIGEIFVPGQVMDTIDGPKFIPGSVHETIKGPLFVPGQVRSGEFIPGEIIDTEDGPRFVTPEFAKEKVFTFMVQSFDLHPIEIDIVRYQYHTPQPSPTFEGQDVCDAINLMQLAAKGYQAKMLPLPEQIPVPPKTKQQIFDNVQLTLLECLDRVKQIRDASADGTVSEECVTRHAKKLQRTLLDNIDHAVKTSTLVSFLTRFISLPNSSNELKNWLDGLFWHSKRGIFQVLEDIPKKPERFGSHVSLSQVIAQLCSNAPLLRDDAQRKDAALKELAEITNKSLPDRSYTTDLAQRCSLLLSRLLITAGKEILYAVYMSLCQSNRQIVFQILDVMKHRLAQVSSDHDAVTALEITICSFVTDITMPWLEQLQLQLHSDDRSALDEDIINEAVGLALLEREADSAKVFCLCLQLPPATGLIKLHNVSIKFLHNILALHVLAGDDNAKNSQLQQLTKNRENLRGSIQWINLLCGAKLITENSGLKADGVENVTDLPPVVIDLITNSRTPALEQCLHRVLVTATRQLHCADLASEPGPAVVLVKGQFQCVVPANQETDVVNGKVDYLTMKPEGIQLFKVGQLDSKRDQGIKESTFARGNMKLESKTNIQSDTCNAAQSSLGGMSEVTSDQNSINVNYNECNIGKQEAGESSNIFTKENQSEPTHAEVNVLEEQVVCENKDTNEDGGNDLKIEREFSNEEPADHASIVVDAYSCEEILQNDPVDNEEQEAHGKDLFNDEESDVQRRNSAYKEETRPRARDPVQDEETEEQRRDETHDEVTGGEKDQLIHNEESTSTALEKNPVKLESEREPALTEDSVHCENNSNDNVVVSADPSDL